MIITELSQTIMTELILSNEQQKKLCNTSEDAMMSMYSVSFCIKCFSFYFCVNTN